jgi:hypothetical protein
MKKLLSVTLFFALATMSALAADFNGKWTAEVPSRQGGNTTNTFTFKVDGSKLTGSMSTQMGDTEISNGKVEGDNISFDVVRTFNENKFTLSYTGKAEGADSIKFTRSFKGDMPGGGGQAPPPQEFTAKKAQ